MHTRVATPPRGAALVRDGYSDFLFVNRPPLSNPHGIRLDGGTKRDITISIPGIAGNRNMMNHY